MINTILASVSKKHVALCMIILVACPGWLFLIQSYLQNNITGKLAEKRTFSRKLLAENITSSRKLLVENITSSRKLSAKNTTKCTSAPNCTLLFEGNQDEMKRVNLCKGVIPPDDQFLKNASTCEWIRTEFERDYYVSQKEKNFSLAFALNMHNSPQQIFRFLKVIYRPHNVYCIHYDQKSHKSFKNLMITMSECLPNVIVPRKIENVVRGWHTVVDAQMNCMSDLYALRDRYPWKYVTTLCGKEVPLRTNREMVETLMKLNGTSAVTLSGNLPRERYYWEYRHTLSSKGKIVKTKERLGPIPFDLEMAKSLAYFSLSPEFVDFLLNDQRAKEFRKFTDKTFIPEEHFIPTLFTMKGVPGGKDDRYTKYIPKVISCIWLTKSATNGQPKNCGGEVIHKVCVIASDDLHRLQFRYNPNAKRQVFFHNKFFLEKDRVVMDCAEQELVWRNKNERDSDLNASQLQ